MMGPTMCHMYVSHVTCHMSCVMFHVSCVMCHVSCVMCHVSCVIYHVSGVKCQHYFILSLLFSKEVEVVSGGAIIKGAYLV